MPPIRIDLTAPDLVGNDAAEDEEEPIFLGYAVERPEVLQFLDPSRRIAIARAFKGEGKSALLRLVKTRLSKASSAPLIIAVSGKNISPVSNSTDTDVWVREWKKSILQVVAREIGSKIGMAWSDDAIALVEEAEQAGFKSRSLVSSIFDRLKSSAVPLQRERQTVANPERIIQRWVEKEDQIWLFIDDVDENFKNNEQYLAKVGSFFIAVRDIANAIPGIRFRLAVRPGTWTSLTHEYEALSKVSQYNIDLRWNEGDLRDLLVARIKSYLERTGQHHEFTQRVSESPTTDMYLSLLFETPVQWGGQTRPIYVPLVTLARMRPRWLVELTREAAEAAAAKGHAKIYLSTVFSCLEAFGQRRIADTIAEFKSQCPQVGELIAAFSRQSEEYSTADLLSTIQRRVLDHVSPNIEGVSRTPSHTQVAAFLFQIGFLSARRELGQGQYEHLTYSDQPGLLRDRTNIDDGVRWEIHPVFRQALQMRDASGQILRTPGRDRRGR